MVAGTDDDRAPRPPRTGDTSGHSTPVGGPAIPIAAQVDLLDPDVLEELATLPSGLAQRVGRHLVAAGLLLDENPDDAYAHAAFARELAPRLAAVREAAGLVSYRTGRYAEAKSDLRAARRISGSFEHLPVLADIERALGRPDRALELAGAPEVRGLDAGGQIEMRIVAAGARRDQEQLDAALVTLQTAQLNDDEPVDAVARLRYAFADALLEAGRTDDALQWFMRAAELDEHEDTDAAMMVAELSGTSVSVDEDESAEES